jgi:hypothetical protein
MGNFSRDPNARMADAVAKHYIAVRQQQAVPVLDADWNLLDDLRRGELETLGSSFIGDGVPVGSDGFHILALAPPQPNDFSIRAGLCIVGGKLTRNDADTTYATLAKFGNPNLVPPLAAMTTPPVDKTFIVYLDVFEEEVDSLRDPDLVDVRIGIETAIRLRRNWAVRVAGIPEDLPQLASPPAGHLFLQLAQLNRTAGTPNITAAMITDLRDTQLSIKRKIEVRDGSGHIVVRNADFQQMLTNTRNNLLKLIRFITTPPTNPIANPLTSAEILGLQAADHIARAADAGLALVNSSSLANPGALPYMRQLYDAQENFVRVWTDVVLQLPGAKYASLRSFVQRLDDRLNAPQVGQLTGLLAALNTGDLAAAVAMQNEITRLFGTVSGTIPRGAITVFLANSPPGNLTINTGVRFEFHVRSETTLTDLYTVKVLPETGWPRTVVDVSGNPIPNNKVPIGPAPDEVPIRVDVSVQTGSSDLQLQVTSDSNPDEITQISNLFPLTAGQPAPPDERNVQISVAPNIVNGTKDPVTGAINVSRTRTCTLHVQVFNNAGQNGMFTLGIAKQAEVAAGSWNAVYNGDLSTPINNGQFADEPIAITPAANAVSVQIVFSASATIQGSTVSGQFVIPFVAVP